MTYFRSPDPGFEHRGMHYLEFLGMLAKLLGPRSYFEIGTAGGNYLARFACDAVCVDPAFRFAANPTDGRRRTLLYQMVSDDFFANFDLLKLFPHGLDIAFLDGMHRFEHLLADFMNTERFCHRHSLIILHDCLPFDLQMAERIVPVNYCWTGDVWKLFQS